MTELLNPCVTSENNQPTVICTIDVKCLLIRISLTGNGRADGWTHGEYSADIRVVQSILTTMKRLEEFVRFVWCLTVSLSISHRYPGSGVVLDCIDS